ncbi:MAG: hypothetical protein ACRD24_06050, partial [Terriglobales bacterium]
MTRPLRWAFGVALSMAAVLAAAAQDSVALPATVCPLSQASAPTRPNPQIRRGRAIWIWETAFLEDARRIDEVLRFARKQGARTLFLYAPVWRLEEQPETVRCFLAEAHRRKFNVHALQGEPQWVYPAQRAG